MQKSIKTFVKTVHSLFSQRRKTLANNIKPVLPPSVTADEFFEKAGIFHYRICIEFAGVLFMAWKYPPVEKLPA